MISLLDGGGAKPGKKLPEKALTLRLEIVGSEPRIWRRLVVRESMWLSQLHETIQVLFDWFDYQTHTFLLGTMRAGNPVLQGELLIEDDRDIALSDFSAEQLSHFGYEYHFGETWRVALGLEKATPAEPGQFYPRCLAGERAGPPEDCGGLEAFADMLHCLQDPSSKMGKEWLEWLGESYDPTECDLDKINKSLRKLLKGSQ